MSAGKVIANNVGKQTARKFRAALEVTPNAAKRLSEIISARNEEVLGVRLGVKKRGCNGLSYTLDYARERKPADEVVTTEQGVNVFIDPQALMTVIGTKMDWIEDHMKAEFVFINPNAKSACGCGESFNVE